MMQRYVVRRQSSLAAAKKISAQVDEDDEPDVKPRPPAPANPKTKPRQAAPDAEVEDDTAEPRPKRRKTEKPRRLGKADAAKQHADLFGPSGEQPITTAAPPSRTHAVAYHRPLLLDSRAGRDALLAWFDATSTARGMPWRKAWIDPAKTDAASLRAALERRAYEVWISEIMLQQTRVAVVIDYWNRWMARWPTIQDLAAATPEDVLGAWRGLGYYSRATRIHEAAKLVVAEDGGLMPADVAELERRVPGVGRYTAGAISAIVFGRPAAMVDGNVLRVLSRQAGVYGNVKTDKGVIDMLWAAAEALARAVAGEEEVSDRPGRWGQALMELGSTVCTPKPGCGECPVTTTCRAYAEGAVLAGSGKRAKVEDIEDACAVCEPFEEGEDEGVEAEESDAEVKKPKKGTRSGKQSTLAAFRFTSKAMEKEKGKVPVKGAVDARMLEVIANYAKKFPLKVAKKAVREEEALVCAVRRPDGRVLIHRRPEKGLLAGLWELPSHTLAAADSNKKNTAASRKKEAQTYVSGLVSGVGKLRVRHGGELGSVPWVFSHLKLTMHVHVFEVEGEGEGEFASSYARFRWATEDEVEDESMGTGMRKCWALVRESMDA